MNKKKQLYAEYLKLAHKADRRMLRLEQAAASGKAGDALKYAYYTASSELAGFFTTTRTGKPRFEKAMPKDITVSGIKKLTRVAENFLASETSTIGGIHKVYDKRSEEIANKYGARLSREDLRIFDNERFRKVLDQYGSKTVMRVIGMMQSNEKNIQDYLSGARKRNVLYEDMKPGSVDRQIAQKILQFKNVREQFFEGL